ncbi:MAG: TolC family protein [Nevskiaceae bacterium]|nr:MAG: TolC family protein [Nevskiaceae bacterium]
MCEKVHLLRLLTAAVLLLPLRVALAGAAACDSAQLTLENATWQMLESNPQLDQARGALAGARADRLTAGERPNPTLSFNSSSYNLRNGLGSGDAWHKRLDSILRVDQTIERGNKRGLRLDATAAGIDGAESDYRELVRQLRLAVAGAYYDLLRAQQRLDLSQQLAELQHQTEAAARRRLEAGDIAESDLARIRVESARADSDVQNAQADLESARIALAHLMGCSSDATLAASTAWPNPQAEWPLTATATDVAARPDVLAAAARTRQAHAMARLAEAQRTRDITVGLQYEHFPPDGQNLLGAGFSVPLFLFNRYEGEIARAHADAETADAAERQARADAQADVAQALSAVRHAAERARRARSDLLPLSEKAAAAMDYAYAHGAAGLEDLLDARRGLRAARLEALDAQADYAKALTAWQLAGNPPQHPVPESTP